MCTALEQSFPKTLSELKRLGPVKLKNTEAGSDFCDPEDGCEVRNVEMPGLSLSLLVTKSTQKLDVLSIKVSRPKWQFFEDVRIGASLTSAGDRFGAKLTSLMRSPVHLVGECAGLVLDHKNGRVTGISLDCQACW